MLDVPISGSTLAVEQGNITLFAGGDYPIFESLAIQTFYIGPAGSGAVTKLAVNALLGLGMQAPAEAVAFGQKAGTERNQLLEFLSRTPVVAPAYAYKLERAKNQDYSPQLPRHKLQPFSGSRRSIQAMPLKHGLSCFPPPYPVSE